MRTRAIVVVTLFATAAHLVAIATVLSVYDRLPARSNIFTSLATSLAFTAVFTLLVAVLTPKNSGGTTAALGSGMGVFLAALLGGTTVLQADSSAADPLQFRSWWLLPVILLAVAAGALAARITGPGPALPQAVQVPATSERLPANDPRRTWVVTLTSSPWFLLVLLLPLPVFLVLAYATRDWLLPVLCTAAVAMPLLGMWRWRLRADAEGFSAIGLVGWPRVRHRLDEIETASAIRRVEAMEFGGPGLRLTREGARLALRTGPGLRLELSDGTDFIVTVPDAELAARTLNTLIAEQRA